MIHLYRARLGLLAAVLVAVAILVLELPVGELLHQRGELRAVSTELSVIQARNASLSADVAALSAPDTVSAIAHEEYGLVRPGQRSYVILPSAGSTEGAPGLESQPISPKDLVAVSPTPTASVSSHAPAEPGFWSRFAQRLEFWRWAF